MHSNRNIHRFKSALCNACLTYAKPLIFQKFRAYSSQELQCVPLPSIYTSISIHSFFLFLDCVYEDEDIEREGLRVAEFFEPCEDFGSGR